VKGKPRNFQGHIPATAAGRSWAETWKNSGQELIPDITVDSLPIATGKHHSTREYGIDLYHLTMGPPMTQPSEGEP
jgi:hypothetical protein